MDNRSFWNEVAKYGLLLGLAMSGSKIFEQSLVINGGLSYALWVMLEWVLFAVLFFVILFKATKRRAASIDPVVGYGYGQAINYMILISTFAAVPVACLYYVYINSIIGYDNYVEGLVGLLVQAAEMQPMDSSTASAVELVIEQLRHQPQPSIMSVFFNTVVQYAFAGLFAGLIMGGFVTRKPEIFENQDEQ